jgi:hypothetical protein
MRSKKPPGKTEEQRCVRCGCTDAVGCPGGCWWVRKNLCSSCLTPEEGEELKQAIAHAAREEVEQAAAEEDAVAEAYADRQRGDERDI